MLPSSSFNTFYRAGLQVTTSKQLFCCTTLRDDHHPNQIAKSFLGEHSQVCSARFFVNLYQATKEPLVLKTNNKTQLHQGQQSCKCISRLCHRSCFSCGQEQNFNICGHKIIEVVAVGLPCCKLSSKSVPSIYPALEKGRDLTLDTPLWIQFWRGDWCIRSRMMKSGVETWGQQPLFHMCVEQTSHRMVYFWVPLLDRMEHNCDFNLKPQQSSTY